MVAEKKITITVKAAVSGGIAIGASVAGLVWLLVTFVFAEAKDDIASVRADVAELRAAVAAGDSENLNTDLGIRQEMTELTAQLRETTQVLASLAETVGGLDESIATIDSQLTASVIRQTGFEAYVIAKLGLEAGQTPQLPARWLETQLPKLQRIFEGPDPLLNWQQGRD